MYQSEYEIRAHIDRLEGEVERILAARAVAEAEPRRPGRAPRRRSWRLADGLRYLLSRPLPR